MHDHEAGSTRPKIRLSIIGSAGVPARYGGFETLVENLATHSSQVAADFELTIYCSGHYYPERNSDFQGARLRYVPLNANGAQSILYDIWSLALAVLDRADVVLVLGVSGAVAIPVVRSLTKVRIVTNVDGIEWQRDKWRGLSRWILRISERLAARHSHVVIADNGHIVTHIRDSYGVSCRMIPYGGDHVLIPLADVRGFQDLPPSYGLSICRIEPENNIGMILEAFAAAPGMALVLIGNWDASSYGRRMRQNFRHLSHLRLLDPIYDLAVLKAIRRRARLYVHGHSAGGTNPSLIEAMHVHRDILAFDCGYNRATTEDRALYFRDAAGLRAQIEAVAAGELRLPESVMQEIAIRRYTWAVVADQYFSLLRAAIAPS